jgi:CheY-specific phosphatase CheX
MRTRIDPVIIKILDVVLASAAAHFKESLDIFFLSTRTTYLKVDTASLGQMTAIIDVSGAINASIAFSFNNALANHLFEVETAGLTIPEAKRASYQSDIISENVNIVIGHSTQALAQAGESIKLSLPIVIEGGDNFHLPQGLMHVSVSVLTNKGSFDLGVTSFA